MIHAGTSIRGNIEDGTLSTPGGLLREDTRSILYASGQDRVARTPRANHDNAQWRSVEAKGRNAERNLKIDLAWRNKEQWCGEVVYSNRHSCERRWQRRLLRSLGGFCESLAKQGEESSRDNDSSPLRVTRERSCADEAFGSDNRPLAE